MKHQKIQITIRHPINTVKTGFFFLFFLFFPFLSHVDFLVQGERRKELRYVVWLAYGTIIPKPRGHRVVHPVGPAVTQKSTPPRTRTRGTVEKHREGF